MNSSHLFDTQNSICEEKQINHLVLGVVPGVPKIMSGRVCINIFFDEIKKNINRASLNVLRGVK